MAPVRRYLRITKYSVLEVRIYLDNPALAQSWLLNPRNPVLPRVIESVRPLVLPKLREEQERERTRKKNKKRSIKDVLVEDDFEVSIFLTATDTRHSLLHKQKIFRDKTQTKLTSNSSKLTGASREAPINVDDGLGGGEGADLDDIPILREEDDDQEPIDLDDIPDIHETEATEPEPANRRPKRRRQDSSVVGDQRGAPGGDSDEDDNPEFEVIDSDADGSDGSDDGNDDLFGEGEGAGSGSDAEAGPPPPKRRKEKQKEERDDKKKLAMDISYEGFAIYGRVLCLVIKRRDGGLVARGSGNLAGPSSSKAQTERPGGQAMMENWITSTQLPEAGGEEDVS